MVTERDLQEWTSQGWRVTYMQGDTAQLERGNAVVVVKKIGSKVVEQRREGLR